MAYTQFSTNNFHIIRDIVYTLTTLNKDKTKNWQLIYPSIIEYSPIVDVVGEQQTTFVDGKIVLPHKPLVKDRPVSVTVNDTQVEQGLINVDYDNGTIEVLGASLTTNDTVLVDYSYYDLDKGFINAVKAITRRAVIKTTTTPVETIITDEVRIFDDSLQKKSIEMYIEFLMPEWLVNPENNSSLTTGKLVTSFKSRNMHYFYIRMFDKWDDTAKQPSAPKTDSAGNVIEEGANISPWVKFSWCKDFEERLYDEFDGDQLAIDPADGLCYVPVELDKYFKEMKVDVFVKSDNDGFVIVAEGDKSITDKAISSFLYAGKIESFENSISDIEGNFALTSGSGTIPSMVVVDGYISDVPQVEQKDFYKPFPGSVNDYLTVAIKQDITFDQGQFVGWTYIYFVTMNFYLQFFNENEETYMSSAYKIVQGYFGNSYYCGDATVTIGITKPAQYNKVRVFKKYKSNVVYGYFNQSYPSDVDVDKQVGYLVGEFDIPDTGLTLTYKLSELSQQSPVAIDTTKKEYAVYKVIAGNDFMYSLPSTALVVENNFVYLNSPMKNVKLSIKLPENAQWIKVYKSVAKYSTDKDTAFSDPNAVDCYEYAVLYKTNSDTIEFIDDGKPVIVDSRKLCPKTNVVEYLVERDVITGRITKIKYNTKYGDNTANGVLDIMMYMTKSGIYYQKHIPSFAALSSNVDIVQINPSRWLNEAVMSPCYVIHKDDGYRGYLRWILVTDVSKFNNHDEFEFEENGVVKTYRYFEIDAPYWFMNSSPNAKYGIVIELD